MFTEEEEAINKRIIAKENNIKFLTLKYLELIKKLNTSARNEIKSTLDEILNEIDLIEIDTLKARNIEILKEREKNVFLNEKKTISKNINNTKDEIIQKKKELYESKRHREYLIKCEEIAKQINKYDTPNSLNEKIKSVGEENDNIIKNKEELDKKFKSDEDKINQILNLVSELKNSYVQSNLNNNSNNNNNNNNNNANGIKKDK